MATTLASVMTTWMIPVSVAFASTRPPAARSPIEIGASERLSRALVKKLLHEPTARLRERAGHGDVDEVASAARELFGLEAPRDP